MKKLHLIFLALIFVSIADVSAVDDRILTPLRKTLLFDGVQDHTINNMQKGEISDHQLGMIVGEGIRLAFINSSNIGFNPQMHADNTFINDGNITKAKAIHRFCQFWIEGLIISEYNKIDVPNYPQLFEQMGKNLYDNWFIPQSYQQHLPKVNLSQLKPKIYNKIAQIKQKIQNFRNNVENVSVASFTPVLFYENKEPFYEFTNFYPAKTGPYKNSEAFFQSEKYTTQSIKQKFLGITAGEAFKIAQQHKPEVAWEDKSDSLNPNAGNIIAMRKALKAKFDQNPKLRALLIGLYGYSFTENTVLDNGRADWFWGNCPFLDKARTQPTAYRNWLGRLLMEYANDYITSPIVPQQNSGAEISQETWGILSSIGNINTFNHFRVKLGQGQISSPQQNLQQQSMQIYNQRLQDFYNPQQQSNQPSNVPQQIDTNKIHQALLGNYGPTTVEITKHGIAITLQSSNAAQYLCNSVKTGCSIDQKNTSRVLFGKNNGVPALLKFTGLSQNVSQQPNTPQQKTVTIGSIQQALNNKYSSGITVSTNNRGGLTLSGNLGALLALLNDQQFKSIFTQQNQNNAWGIDNNNNVWFSKNYGSRQLIKLLGVV